MKMNLKNTIREGRTSRKYSSIASFKELIKKFCKRQNHKVRKKQEGRRFLNYIQDSSDEALKYTEPRGPHEKKRIKKLLI